MDVAREAFRELLAISRADGPLDKHERRLLEQYRSDLDLDEEFVDLDHADPPPAEAPRALLETGFGERIEVLRAMANTALADGNVSRAELRHLRLAAKRLGVKRMRFTTLMLEARRARASKGQITLVAAAAAALVFGAVWLGSSRVRAMSNETRVLDDFKRHARDYEASVLLVVVDYSLERGSERRRRRSTGTGFFVSEQGHIATNAHVLEPWKHREEIIDLVADGWKLDESSVDVAAWTGGARLYADAEQLDPTTGFATKSGSLKVLTIGGERAAQNNDPARGSAHIRNSNRAAQEIDLALLLARVVRPVVPLRLATDASPVEVLDDVLVLGFPKGLSPIEGWHAELSVADGCVRKIEDSITISALVEPGNSGGPVLARSGHVIGIATSRYGSATMGKCIQVCHLHALLIRAGVEVR